LIGSKGRESLRYTLDSIARQDRRAGDLCIVGFDAYEKSDAEIEAAIRMVREYGEGFRAYPYDSGYHWLGVEQINVAIRAAWHRPCSHCFTLGDDDVFVDGAYSRLRSWTDAHPLRPVLYRFLAPWREVLWDQPKLRQSRISGCCIAAPTPFVDVMTTEKIVTHDYRWIVDIVTRACEANELPIWLDELLVVARPDEADRGGVKHGSFYRLGGAAWIQAENIEGYR